MFETCLINLKNTVKGSLQHSLSTLDFYVECLVRSSASSELFCDYPVFTCFYPCTIQWYLAAIALNMFSYTTHLSVFPTDYELMKLPKIQALPNFPTSPIRRRLSSPTNGGSMSHHKGRPVKKSDPSVPNLHLFCDGPVQAPMWFCSFQALLVMTLMDMMEPWVWRSSDDLNSHRWYGKLHKFSHLVCPGG